MTSYFEHNAKKPELEVVEFLISPEIEVEEIVMTNEIKLMFDTSYNWDGAQ